MAKSNRETRADTISFWINLGFYLLFFFLFISAWSNEDLIGTVVYGVMFLSVLIWQGFARLEKKL
jgi:hypothetical protein